MSALHDDMRGVTVCPEGEEAVNTFTFGSAVQLIGSPHNPVMTVACEIGMAPGFKNHISCIWFGPHGEKQTGHFDHRLLHKVEAAS